MDNLISAKTLKQHIGDNGWLIFDCRFNLADTEQAQKNYQQSHIPGAIYTHLDHHLSSPITPDSGRHPLPDLSTLLQWLSFCGLQQKTRVVVYDDSAGAFATRLWWMLKCLGHHSVCVLDGGWTGWVKAGFEADQQLPNLTASQYEASFNGSLVKTTAEVFSNLNSQEFQLIDVRAGERFRGEMEPIDPVAGHIPGAINMPLTDNLDEDGLFKSPQQLRELYEDLSELFATEQQVFMCGSGVTACHSVFAMCLAGFQMPRLYAGSWSEWIRDTARPVQSL